jgi:hypothetical protein
LWRCVTAFPMSDSTKNIYLKRVKKRSRLPKK